MELGKLGLLRGVLERDDVSLHLAALGGLGGGGNLRIGKPGERRFIFCDERSILCGGQQLGSKSLGQAGFFFVQLLQRSLVSVGKVSAGVHEFLVVPLDELVGLRVELQGRPLFTDGLYALKEFRVQEDGVGVSRQFRGLDFLHLLECRVKIRPGHRTESRHGAIE